ncbi:hypothetical protein BH20ACT10_BH20ACT10_23620 [soil metagenome]|jgi:hypothetical protein
MWIMSQSRIPENEITPRGEEVYEREIRPKLGSEHKGKFVVVDVESGDYEVSERMEGRRPGARSFILRVGPDGASRPAYRIARASHRLRFSWNRNHSDVEKVKLHACSLKPK